MATSWWSWGGSAEYVGRAGYVPGGTNPVLLDAQPTSFPTDVEIAALAVQQWAGAACTITGDIYVWGIAQNGGYDTVHGCFGDQFIGSTSVAVVNPPTKLTYAQASSAIQTALTDVATFWLRSDGTVWGVGWNGSGEFGTGEDPSGGAIYHGTPVQLTGLPAGIRKIYAWGYGYGLFAIDSLHRVWFAGSNDSAMDGTGISMPAPSMLVTHTLVAGLPSSVIDICISERHTNTGATIPFGASCYALLSNGTVMFWGRSLIEDPVTSTLYTPTLLSGISGITQLYAANGSGTVYLLTTGGTVLGFGLDQFGALCNGTWSGAAYGSSYTEVEHFALPPIAITLPGGRTGAQFPHGSSATYAMFVVTSDQQVWGWGLADQLWGTGTPGSALQVVPPYAVFPATFNSVQPAQDIAIMMENALFVLAQAGPTVAVPSRLATIVG